MIFAHQDTYRHKGLRRALVETIQKKGINDERVLKAIGSVPRHFFFDPAFIEHAYEDKAFPIGEGQTISQPYTVAFQSELIKALPGNRILEVGTGSGYQACVLLEMGCEVFTIEYNKVLYERTRKFLPKMGYHPRFFQGDGSLGLASFGPYDAILVTAGAPVIPKALVEQLKIGGRLVIPVGDKKLQKMVRLTKTKENTLEKEEFTGFSFVPLLGNEGWAS